jgi:hypothetical protein
LLTEAKLYRKVKFDLWTFKKLTTTIKKGGFLMNINQVRRMVVQSINGHTASNQDDFDDGMKMGDVVDDIAKRFPEDFLSYTFRKLRERGEWAKKHGYYYYRCAIAISIIYDLEIRMGMRLIEKGITVQELFFLDFGQFVQKVHKCCAGQEFKAAFY